MSEKTNQKPVKCGCGGEAEVCKSPLKYGYCYFVKCERCETATNIFVKVEEAIEAWNKAMGADKVDELMEHIWREKLDTREKIADLVERMLR